MLTYEDKIILLKKYKDYVGIATEMKTQLANLREMQLPSSPLIDGMPKNPNHEDHMAKYAVLYSELLEKYDNAVNNVVEITRAINALRSGLERYVVSAYYISGKHLWQIAEDVGYSERHVKRIKRRGIENLKIKKGGD